MWTALFWKDAAERAVRTAAQSAVSVLTVDGIGLLDVSWLAAGSVSGLAALVSLLTSIVASGAGDNTSAGFTTSNGLPG